MKPTTNGFSWPPQKEQNQSQSGNLFQPSQNTQPKQASVLDQARNQVEASTTDIFTNANPTSVKKNTSIPSSSINNIFADLQSSPAENPFAASIAKFQEDRKTKSTSNIFGNLNSEASQGPTTLFNTTSPDPNPPQPKPFSPEAMQTSPDNTPQKDTESLSAPFASMKNATGHSSTIQEKGNDTTTSSGGLFGRVSRPVSELSSQVPPASNPVGAGQSTAGGLFGRVSTPTSSEEGADSSKTGSTDETARVGETSRNPFDEFKVLDKPQNGERENETPIIPFPTSSNAPKQVEVNTGSSNSEVTKDDGLWSAPPAPSYFNDEEKVQYYVASRLKSLDLGLRGYLKKHFQIKDTRPLRRYYDQLKKAIMDARDGPLKDVTGSKRLASSVQQASSLPVKRPRIGPLPGDSPSDTQEQDDGQTTTSNKVAGPLQPLANTNTKRKADIELSRNGTTNIAESAKRARRPESPPKSQTAALFSTILDPSKIDSSKKSPEGAGNGSGSSTISKPVPNIFQPKMPSASNPFEGILGGASGRSPFQPKSSTAPSDEPISSSIPSSMTFGAPSISTQSPASVLAQSFNLNNESASIFAFKPSSIANPSANLSTSPVFKPPFEDTSALSTSSTSDETFTPTNSANTVSAENTASTVFKPPKFSNLASTNFMSQFGEAAKKNAEEAKKKRKAEDYDSEEEDEASWEKKDAEEQQKKRKKIEESAKSAPKFIPTFGTSNISSPGAVNRNPAEPTPKPQPKSVFDSTHPAFNDLNYHNIFGNLSQKDNNPVVRKNDSGDNEEEDEHEPKDTELTSNPNSSNQMPVSTQPLGKSLFDRATNDDKVASSPKSDAASSQTSSSSDHTWKADSPIKFSTGITSPSTVPSTNVTTASPSKAPYTGLFGAGDPMQTPSKLGASVFNSFPSSAPSSGLSFGFGPVKPSTSALAPPSNISSRATSPGATTGESATESAAEGTEESAEKPPQLDLLSERIGEENEDVLYEVRAKGLRFDSDTKAWISKGVGPLRVLKHRETGKRRILLRADPSGKIVINSGFLKEGKYEDVGRNTVRGLLADENSNIGLWQLRVKNDQEVKQLWKIFDENKNFGS